jgi:predicted SAM-dependent methyltransferase
MLGELWHHVHMFRLRLRSRLNPWVRWRQNRFRGQTGLRVNVGCGTTPLEGWVNIDGWYAQGVDLRIDCRHHLPFDDQSVRMIFCEHVFEHFHRPFETDPFLRECHRVLEPKGIVRIVVPDFRKYLEAYLSQDPLPAAGKVVSTHEDQHLLLDTTSRPKNPLEFHTRMEALNTVSHGWWHHKYIYDNHTLAQCFQDSGFQTVIIQSYGKSSFPELAVDTPARAANSIYVEGIRSQASTHP